MNKILSTSDSYETASICDNILYLFSTQDFSTNSYLSTLLTRVHNDQDKLTFAIGIEKQDERTHLLNTSDLKFDSEFICFKSFVHANTLCSDPQIAEAATIVQRKIDLNNPELYRLGYEKEMIAFQSLQAELNSEEVRPCIDRMYGAAEVLAKLEAKALNVKELYREREDWRAEKNDCTPSFLQRKIVRDLLNNELIPFVEVSARIDSETFGSIEKKMSQYIDTINSKIRLHTKPEVSEIVEEETTQDSNSPATSEDKNEA